MFLDVIEVDFQLKAYRVSSGSSRRRISAKATERYMAEQSAEAI